MIYSQRRDAAKTIEYLSRLIELEPDNAQAYLSVGLAQLTLGRTDDAVATVRGLLARDPENVKAVIMLAEILLRRGDPGEAAGLFERAGELDGRIPRVWNSLAQCYLALQRTAAARDALKRSLSIDPDQPEVARKLTALGG